MSSVLQKAKQLNKEFQNDRLATMANFVPTYERLSCGDLGMDYPLFGGIVEGRIIQFTGKWHSGKTLAASVYMAAYQRKYPEKVCVFVDVEHALDMEFISTQTGLDLTKLVYVNPENMSGEQVLDTILEFQDADDIGMIILDSIPALTSALELENDIEVDKGQAATMAKPLARFTKRMVDLVSKKKNILLLINQTKQVGQTANKLPIYDEPGGGAPKFYSSITVRFGTRTYTIEDKVDKSDGEGADGFRLKFMIVKNKCGSVARGGGFLTFRYATGLDWVFDTIEIALKYEFIKRPNNQTYQLVDPYTGELLTDEETGEALSFRGKAKVQEYLNSHIEFQTKYLSMLNDYIQNHAKSYGSLLDERSLAELKQEEAAVKTKEEDFKDED